MRPATRGRIVATGHALARLAGENLRGAIVLLGAILLYSGRIFETRHGLRQTVYRRLVDAGDQGLQLRVDGLDLNPPDAARALSSRRLGNRVEGAGLAIRPRGGNS